MDNKKLKSIKEALFTEEVLSLEKELTNPALDEVSIGTGIEVVRAAFKDLGEISSKLCEEFVVIDDEPGLLAEERKRRSYYAKLQTLEIKVFKALNPSTQPAGGGATTTAAQPDVGRVNLPQRTLVKFDGDVRNWNAFWGSFQDIDKHTSLSDADKFQYLKDCVPPESAARKSIEGYLSSSKNYKAALETLKKLYGRENVIVKVCVRDLLDLVGKNSNEQTRLDFMDLYPKLSSHIRNLKEMGITSDKYEAILYPVVESCLPPAKMEAWQRNVAYEEKLDPLMDFLEKEVHNQLDRSLAQMQFSSATEVPAVSKKSAGKKEKIQEIPTATGFMATSANSTHQKKKKKVPACVFCKDQRHSSDRCGKAKGEMSLEQKMTVLRESKCCYRCLEEGHRTKDCKVFVRCCICGGSHYEVVCSGRKDGSGMMMAVNQQGAVGGVTPGSCYEGGYPPQQQFAAQRFGQSQYTNHPPPPPPLQQPPVIQQPLQPQQQLAQSQQPPPSAPRIGFTSLIVRNERKTLMTLHAIMQTPQGKYKVRMFVDDGSEESYVQEYCARATGCVSVGSQVMLHELFTSVVTEPVNHNQYNIKLISMDGRAEGTFMFNAVDKIASKIRKPLQGDWTKELAGKGIFIDDQSNSNEDVQFLIGVDVAAQIWTGGFYRINPFLCAKETCFGWVLQGVQMDDGYSAPSNIKITRSNMATSMMISNHTVEELWSLEALGIVDDCRAETQADVDRGTCKYFQETIKRQEDGRYVVKLPWRDGHRQLEGNFNQAFIRLRNTTRDLINDGYWNDYDRIFKEWEIEGIIKECKLEDPEKIRSLYLLPHRHVVKENSSTTPVRPVFDASAKGKTGPSLNDCLMKGPNMLELIPAVPCRFRKEEVGAVADVKKAFLQIGLAEEDQEALRFLWWEDESCKKLKLLQHCRVMFGAKPSPFLLAATINYHLEQFGSHTPEVSCKLLDSLYVDNSCSSHGTIEEAKQFMEASRGLLSPAHFDLRGWEFSFCSESTDVPLLGMLWKPEEDTLCLCLDSVNKRMEAPLTKRGLLAIVNSVFDPMGYACAFTILPKLLLQECCHLKLEWDQPLPDEVRRKMEKWKCQVPDLLCLKIPRWLGLTNDKQGVSVHCFSDASGSAFAAYVFVRRETADNVTVQLVMGKSRVAPSKVKLSIPRLELMGCLIGALLTINSVLKYLELEGVPLFFWTDSSTVLTWIKRDGEWTRFVENRVNKIRSLTHREDWYHCPGELNPADVPSRGCSAKYLVESRFWEGPDFLSKPSFMWPSSTAVCKEDEVRAEVRKTAVVGHAQKCDKYGMARLLRFRDYYKILRIVGIVMQFCEKIRVRVKRDSQVSTLPMAERFMEAEKIVLRWIQIQSFSGVGDPRLREMGVFQDEKDNFQLIRIKTQLLYGNDAYGVRCPVVLPHDHPLVKVIILKEHEENAHAGTQALQAILRNKFWIIKSRRTVGDVVTSCVTCRRFLATRCEVPSTPLPMDRIRDTVAFDVTGVDLAGPLLLRGGEKAWIVLFTCSVYRAVHLELVTTLSTRGFLMAFRRFVERRGRPSTMYSDNGTNFVGSNTAFMSIDWKDVERYAAVRKIVWRFSPPAAPWWGGFWERLVGLTKQLLRRVLGKSSVDYEELLTLLCDVEGTLNRRPLTYVSDRKEECLPLSPVMFLRDNPCSELPELGVLEGKSLRASVKIIAKLKDELRSRFRKEYLAMLKHKTSLKKKTVKPGDVVIVEDENRKRMDWRLGVIKQVYPGRDGVVRTALVKTNEGEYLRDVKRLFLMEISEEEPEVKVDAAVEEEKMECEEKAAETTEERSQRSRFGRAMKKPERFGV